MFKSLILAVVLLLVSVSVSASTYGIRGGMLVTGTAVVAPVFVSLSGTRDLFLSEGMAVEVGVAVSVGGTAVAVGAIAVAVAGDVAVG